MIQELREKCARGEFRGVPINTPPRGWKRPRCKPLEAERKVFLRESYDHNLPLSKRLLSFGGSGVCMPHREPDEAAIFYGENL